jgi:hypothetical protein
VVFTYCLEIDRENIRVEVDDPRIIFRKRNERNNITIVQDKTKTGAVVHLTNCFDCISSENNFEIAVTESVN